MSIGMFNENHHAPCICWIGRNTSLFKSKARFTRSFVALNNFPRKQSLGARSITFVLDVDVVRGSYSDIPRTLKSDFTGDELQLNRSVQLLPSTEFSSQVANFKNSSAGFTARESIYFCCLLKISYRVNRLTLPASRIYWTCILFWRLLFT